MKADTDAVVARIQAVTDVASKTFRLVAPRDAQGKVTATPPYAVVQPSDGVDTADRFTGPAVTRHPRYVVHLVGTSYNTAQSLTELVKAQFVAPKGFAIQVTSAEVAGWSGRNLFWDMSQPTQVDDDAKPPMIYNTIELGWDAEPV